MSNSFIWPIDRNTPTASLQRCKTPKRVSWYDTKQSDDEALVMLEHWGIKSTPLLPSLPGTFELRVVAPDRVLSMGQIELNYILMLNWIVWNRTVLTFKMCTYAKLKCLKFKSTLNNQKKVDKP